MENQVDIDPYSDDDNIPDLSAKDKFIYFIQDHSQKILIGIGSIIFICFVSVILYFFVFHKTNLDEFADQFCNCAEQSESEYYNYSKDGFGYKSDITTCFAEDFKAYSNRFSKMEKHQLLIEFKEKVIQKCPNKLANIFEYK
ncbi:MAG: hypothetical protein MK207_12575 [Saprospiraceae bacterium]|nr:hypothetical protein [Saprospiraceae bacterium]